MRTSILSDSQIRLMNAKDIEFYLQDLLLYDNERNRITYQDAFQTDVRTLCERLVYRNKCANCRFRLLNFKQL